MKQKEVRRFKLRKSYNPSTKVSKINFFGKDSERMKDKINDYLSEKINPNVKYEKIKSENAYPEGDIYIIEPECVIGQTNGISYAENLRKERPETEIIFVSENYLSVSEILRRYIKPTGFFLLPIRDQRFFELIYDIIKREAEIKVSKVIVTSGYKKFDIAPEKVLYLMSQNKKILCVFKNGEKLSFYETISHLEEVFPKTFFRCHAGFLVNTSHVVGYDKKQVALRLDNGEMIPVSRKYKSYLSGKIRKVL